MESGLEQSRFSGEKKPEENIKEESIQLSRRIGKGGRNTGGRK